MKTKRIFAAILSVALCMNFASCSNDDDNDINPDNAKKRLVSITYKDVGMGTFNIEYSGGKVSKITEAYKSAYYWSNWVSNYTYTGNGVKEKIDIKNAYGEDFSIVNNYTLNSKGYIESGEIDDEGIWSLTYSGDYLTSASMVMEEDEKRYEEEYYFDNEGRMIGNRCFEGGIEYTDIPNLGGLFLAYEAEAFEVDYSNLQYASLLGKAPKYLPKFASYGDGAVWDISFHYELDDDGYVKKVTVMDITENETLWTETYTYEEIK